MILYSLHNLNVIMNDVMFCVFKRNVLKTKELNRNNYYKLFNKLNEIMIKYL